MYPHPYPRSRSSGTLLPFLILIIIGLTFVFGFQIFQYFREQNQKETENKAALTIIKGRAEMKVWGEENFVPAITGSILREGDRLRLPSGSRASLALLNGSFLRADEDTEFQFTALKTRDLQDEMTINLDHGDVWLKKPKKEDVKIAFTVDTLDFSVTATSTIFSVSKREDFRTRVMDGNVTVHVKEVRDSKTNVIETIQIGVGQEFVATNKTLQAFRERKAPDAIFAHSDAFRASEWYSWNMSQDASAKIATLSVEEAVKAEKESEKSEESGKILEAPKVIEPEIPSPEILEPDTAHRTTNLPNLLVRGTTSAKTQKIIVKTFVAGKEDAYTLQKYTPGSTNWNYIVAESYGNWIPGTNRFHIIAVDAKGLKSEPTELTLLYDKAKPSVSLKAPVTLGFNGQTSSETIEDTVKVEGSIGKGIVKVYVNDFVLTQYVPNSETWIYFAKPQYGNLKEGVNSYEIYGLDADGRKTPVTKFTITKKQKPPESAALGESSPLE